MNQSHNNEVAIHILIDAWHHYNTKKDMTTTEEQELKASLAHVIMHFGTQEQYHLFKDNY